MLKQHNPSTVAPPFSRYGQAIEAPANCRWLHISGQVGVDASGRLAEGFAGQAQQAWRNVIALLHAGEMSPVDLVKVTIYLLNREDLAASRNARDNALGDARPASTLVIVSGLASAEWLIEIEAIAARPVT